VTAEVGEFEHDKIIEKVPCAQRPEQSYAPTPSNYSASRNSRNGPWKPQFEADQAMVQDTHEELSIDACIWRDFPEALAFRLGLLHRMIPDSWSFPRWVRLISIQLSRGDSLAGQAGPSRLPHMAAYF
jgi:hypothetical protein